MNKIFTILFLLLSITLYSQTYQLFPSNLQQYSSEPSILSVNNDELVNLKKSKPISATINSITYNKQKVFSESFIYPYDVIIPTTYTSKENFLIISDQINGKVNNKAIQNKFSTHYIFTEETPQEPVCLQEPVQLNNQKTKQSSNSFCNKVKLSYFITREMFEDFNLNPQEIIDYVTAITVQTQKVYSTINVNLLIEEIVIEEESYYDFSSSLTILNQFRDKYNGNYKGNVALLLDTQPTQNGGIAYLNTLCNKKYGIGYSNISKSYNTFPNYSWTIMVIAHELGHIFGANHTHACVWNGNNTAIDGCFNTEGNCQQPPIPNKGTVMSYCHLRNGSNLEFHPQVEDVIFNTITSSGCLDCTTDEDTTYCSSTPQSNKYEYIDKVVFNNTVFTSGQGNFTYQKFSDTIHIQDTLSVSIIPGFTSTNSFYENYKVWIDINQNNIYDDNELIHHDHSNKSNSNFSYYLPEGTYNIRISQKWKGDSSEHNQCSNHKYGEVEDYIITVKHSICPTPKLVNVTINPNSKLSAVKLDLEDTNIDFQYKTNTDWIYTQSNSSTIIIPETSFQFRFKSHCEQSYSQTYKINFE